MRGAGVTGFADFCDCGKKLLLARDTRPRIGDIFDNLPRVTISKDSRDSRAVGLRVVPPHLFGSRRTVAPLGSRDNPGRGPNVNSPRLAFSASSAAARLALRLSS